VKKREFVIPKAVVREESAFVVVNREKANPASLGMSFGVIVSEPTHPRSL